MAIGRGLLAAAALGLALLAPGLGAQPVRLVDASQVPVTQYLIGTESIFIEVTDPAANLAAGGSNDTTSINVLDIPGLDTETFIALGETTTPGVFFGPAGGVPLNFAAPSSGNGQIDAKDGDVVQAFYAPLSANVIVPLRKTPTPSVVRLLNAGLSDVTLYFLGSDTAVLQVQDDDENRNPVGIDTVTVNASVAPGGDSENFVLTETGLNTSIFRASTVPVVGVASPDGMINGSSGATLTLAFVDPEDGPPAATDTATLLQVTASTTQITDSAGTPLVSQPLPNSLFFVTVVDSDQNLDAFTVETVQVAVTSTVTGDTLTLTLSETTNNSGIFRNSTGATVVQTALASGADAILQTDNGATLTASYQDPVRPADQSSDNLLAQVANVASITEFTDATQTPVAFYDVPGGLFVRVRDSDQNSSASTVQTVQVQLGTTGLVGGDVQTITLSETGANTGIFFSAAVPAVRDPTPSGANGTLEVLQGDTVTATYVDPTDAGDTTQDTAAINIRTAATIDFIASGSVLPNDYRLGEGIVVEVVDVDENQSHLVAEVLNLAVGVTSAGGLDLETLTLTETGLDTSRFRSDGTLLSAVNVAVTGNGTMEVVIPESLTATYTDPNDASDVVTGPGTVVANEQNGTIDFSNAGGTPKATYFIGVEAVFVTVNDQDENQNATLVESLSLNVVDSGTGDVEPLTLQETGADTGIFRNLSGLPSNIQAVVTGNGILETGDLSFITANYLDPDSGVLISDFATMRVTQTASVTSLTDSTGAVVAIYRIGLDPLFVTVTDPDENTRATDPQILGAPVRLTNLTNGDTELLVLNETGNSTGVFRNPVGFPSSLPVGPITTGDGILTASDGDLVQVVYIDDDDPADSSADNAILQFLTTALVRLTDFAGAQVNLYPFLNAFTDGIYITVTDFDQNMNPLVQEVVTATLRHVPAGAGEALFGVTLTETTSNSGVFRNTTFIDLEIDPPVLDTVLQSFDGAQVQATYVDPNDAADTQVSNIATLRATPEAATVAIGAVPATLIQTTAFAIGVNPVFVTVVDPDQDLNSATIDTIQVVVIDLATGDSVNLTLSETDPNSDGLFTNAVGLPLQIGPNAPDMMLQTAHLATFVANYTDPTPGDGSLDFDSAISVLNPTPEVVTLTDGNGVPVNPFLIGVDQVFVTVMDADENTNGSSAQTSSIVTVTSTLGDTEFLSLVETSGSSPIFRTTPGLPLVQSAIPLPNNGILEVDAGDQLTATYLDQRDPGIGGFAMGISFVQLPPVVSVTRFTDSGGVIQASYLIGAGDIFLTVIDSDENADNSMPDTVTVTVTASITGDSETGVILTETGNNTGVFRNLVGIPSEIDVATIDDGTLQLAGASVMSALYVDADDASDVSTATATLQVPQVSAAQFVVTTDISSVPVVTPVTVAFIDSDLLFFLLEDIDQNTDPTTTETVDILVQGTGSLIDSVTVRLVELDANSSFFLNDGTSSLPSPVPTATTGLASVIDPVSTTDFLLQTFHDQLIQATYVDPQSVVDTLTTTFRMRVFEDSSNTFFSDGAGTPKATFPIAPLDPLLRIFVTVEDQDENLNASTVQSIVVTLTDTITGDVETLVLLETGPDTNTFRNVTGINSQLLPPVPGDGILQTGDLSDVVASYQDSEDPSDISSDTATMVATQGAATIRLTDQAGFDRSVYRMVNVTSEQIYLTVTDADENKNPLLPDVVTVELESQSNGDIVTATLTETGNATGVFRTLLGTTALPGCFPIADGILQGAHNATLRATYTDTDDPFDTAFDLATLINAPSFAAGFLDFLDNAVSMTPVTTFLIEGPGVVLSVSDADENEDPCSPDTVDVTLTVIASGDVESVTLTETGTSTGLFVGPAPGIGSLIDPPVLGDGTLQVKHPTQLEARYVDNDNLSDQAVANASSIMFETLASCGFLADLAGNPKLDSYGIGTELIFIEIEDRDRDTSYDTQESLTVSLLSTGTLDLIASVTLLETGNHTGVFRNSIPTPPNPMEGIPSQIATVNSLDATLQTSDGEQVLLTYIDPTDPSDICTDLADLELKPTTSVTRFTDILGNPRSFFSINFDNVFVTVTDLDENADPTLIETITVEVRSLFALPASEDVEIIDLEEIAPNAGVFRNVATSLPMEVGSAVLGDGILQTGDGLTILATYTDADSPPTDVSTSTARTFVASSNSTVTFTDDGLATPVFQYFIGDNDIYVEVFDPDENVNAVSVQSVIVTVQVTATGDAESFVLFESDDFGPGVVDSVDSDFFRNRTTMPIQSVLAAGGVPGNGVLEVINGAFLTATYVDNDFPADTSTNFQSVVMRVSQTTSTIRLLNQNLIPDFEYLVAKDSLIIEITDFDQNGNPSVNDSVVVTVDTFDLAFDLETFVATEIGPNAGIFRTAPIQSVKLTPPATGISGNGKIDAVGDLPGGLGEDFFEVMYVDPDDGTDISTDGAVITTQEDAGLQFTNSLGSPVTTYIIGVDRIFLRLTDNDQNFLPSIRETVVVTVSDFGTGDFEPVTLQETANNSGIFFNTGGLVTVFDLTAIPGDGVLQTGDPSSTTAEAEYIDADFPSDNQLDTADLVPLDPNDRDGDGIPNAVELANGLDPNDPADATQDNDLDGRNNRTELVVDFTDPNDDGDNAPVPVIQPLNVNLDPGVIQLDGSASIDQTTLPPNIGIIAYLWSQVGATPAPVVLSSPTSVSPFFVARTPGIYTIRLTVTDADGAQRSDTSDIEINDVPPNADPGPPGDMRINSAGVATPSFQLDGSKSEDANAQALTFLWTPGPGNEVGAIVFDNPTLAKPKILSVGRVGRAVVRLTVTDPSFQSSSRDLTILVHDDQSGPPFQNHTPTSEAGQDQVVTAGPGVTAPLRGQLSSDADGEALLLTPPPAIGDLGWIYLGGPVTGGVAGNTLLNATATGLSQVGVYTFGLRVHDNHAGGGGAAVSHQDRVRIIAQTPTNHVPTASAGGNYNFSPLVNAQLNGSGSGDADPADVLSFQWTQISGVATPLDLATVQNPTVTFYDTGVYRYQLVVTDLLGNVSLPSVATVVVGRPGDNPPIANAGVDQVGMTGVPVLLDGTGSVDLDSQPLSFYWRQSEGTRILLSDRSTAQPTFTPPRAGTYEFELVVDDGFHFSPVSRVRISVDPPIANAGPDQNLFLASGGGPVNVNLNGTGSFDPQPGPSPLTFTWTQVGGPTVTLSNPNAPQPAFSAAVPGVYRFLLIVDDGVAQSAQIDLNNSSDPFVTINVSSSASTTPTANAGPDQFVVANATVTLNGSASFDADGDPLTFLWTQIAGTPVFLSPSSVTATPSFLPPVGGQAYTFRLTVRDPGGKSSTDQVTIFATGGTSGGGGGNTLPPTGTVGTFAQGSGGGGGCNATPLWLKGDTEDHLPQVLLNLLLLLLPFLTALSYRREALVRVPARRSSQKL